MKVSVQISLAALLIWGSTASPMQAQEAPLFADVTEETGLTKVHRLAEGWARMVIGTGAAWFDYNNDGHLDLFLTQGKGKNDLYHNNGDGTFTEIGRQMGVEDWSNQGTAVAVADYDNDGWTDIFLANADEDVLLRNNAGQGFTVHFNRVVEVCDCELHFRFSIQAIE